MITTERLDAIEIRLRQWCQSKVERLTRHEIAEYRLICDEICVIREGMKYGNSN